MKTKEFTERMAQMETLQELYESRKTTAADFLKSAIGFEEFIPDLEYSELNELYLEVAIESLFFKRMFDKVSSKVAMGMPPETNLIKLVGCCFLSREEFKLLNIDTVHGVSRILGL